MKTSIERVQVVRELRLELLACHSHTGRLLTESSRFTNALVQRGNMDVNHAAMCMELFFFWDLYLVAEQWAVNRDVNTPATLPEALVLLHQWRKHCVH